MKILIISPYFPPAKSVATVRMASLSQFLINQESVEVTVLTNAITNDFNERIIPHNLKKIVIKEVIESKSVKYFKNFVENYQLYKVALESLLKIDNYDIVLISVGPYYTLSLAKLIKIKYKTKCILDYRDLWIFEKNYRKKLNFNSFKVLLTKIICFPIELSSIIYADKIVTVTDDWKMRLKKIYPFFRHKFEVIYNGYDDQLVEKKDLAYQWRDNLDNEFTIANYGKLSYYSPFYSEIFFQAIKSLKNDILNIKVLQVGNFEAETENIISKLGISSKNFECTGFCDYRKGLQKINKSNILIIIDNRPDAIGTKIYDYIFLNKPIIYIGPKNGSIPYLLSNFSNSFVCSETQEVIEAIKYIYSQKILNLSEENNFFKYARSFQNKKYYKLIKELEENDEGLD